MTSAWYNPYHQQGYIPSTPDNPGPARQGQVATQPNVDNIIQGCPCLVCSRARNNYQMFQRAIEFQDPSVPESIVPHANENFGGDYPSGIAATVGGHSQEWPVTLQAPQDQENIGYVPTPVAEGPIQIQTGAASDQAQVHVMSIPERLRRLAVRYVSDPESLVNGVHLESGPSGRFQVVITVEISDVLGDTIN